MANPKRWTRPARAQLTLGALFRRYVSDGKYLPDGSLKTDAYLDHVSKTGENLTSFFDEEYEVRELTPERVARYVHARRIGDITGQAVGTNCIKLELRILKAALTWACGVHEDGQPLLDKHPIEQLKVPYEKNPRRPVVDHKTVEALLAVAPQVHPALPLLITLARTTGRRLGSILGLRWDDFDFDNGPSTGAPSWTSGARAGSHLSPPGRSPRCARIARRTPQSDQCWCFRIPSGPGRVSPSRGTWPRGGSSEPTSWPRSSSPRARSGTCSGECGPRSGSTCRPRTSQQPVDGATSARCSASTSR